MPELKKERIKDQMLRTAARLWGVPESEIETNFDPLILLIMESCAAELEKIGYEINASQTRLLERFADIIIPEAIVRHVPASCVMHATPVDASAKLEPSTRFYASQRIQRSGAAAPFNLDIFFTPIGTFPIHKATLSYLLIGNKLYKADTQGKKEVMAGDDSGKINEIWLAIEPDKAVQSLNGLSIYFDMRGHSEANTFYGSLQTAKAYVNGEQIGLNIGYSDHGQFEVGPNEMLVSGHGYAEKVNRQVAAIYRKHFLSISNLKPVQEQIRTGVPDEWKQLLPENVLKQVSAKPMVYLQVKLGRHFHQDVLDRLVCSINAFPAVNRKVNTINYRTDSWMNIIPLQVEGSFLDMHEISAATGGKYKFNISADMQDVEEGEAIVRSSGVGKANSGEVREIIGRLTEAIRDESAYFSEISNDFILSRLREISQVLARLEDQIAKAKDNHQANHYVLLKPRRAGEQVILHYWTSNGTDAHNVKAGAYLNAFNHTLVAAKNAYTLSNAVGGRHGVSDAEKRLLLRQQLSSGGRIVSAEDIKLECFRIFGNKLKNVEVKKGVQVGAGNNEGFSRVIEVNLALHSNVDTSDLEYFCDELEHSLETKASPVYPFKVTVV
jgi:hypothetical protein